MPLNTNVLQWVNPTKQRYYVAQLQQDLLQDWIVTLHWGRAGTRLGRHKIVYCESEKIAHDYLAKLDRIRVKRGYQRLTN